MDCVEDRVDLRKTSKEEREEGQRIRDLVFKLNQTNPSDTQFKELLKEIFGDNLGENSGIATPISGACINRMVIGKML